MPIMSHVAGSITNDNTPVVGLSGIVDVPFIMPAGGTAAKVDLASRKVSVNGRLLAVASTLCTVIGDATAGFKFHVTNRETLPWPAVCYVVVECPYPVTAGAGTSATKTEAMLVDHEARLP